MKSILNIEVSCFGNYDTPTNPKQVNLLSWLQSDKYKDKVDRIRAIEDKTIRDELKATLPAITASGVFSYRAKKNMLKHSGFIAIDIDFKGNETIGNFSELKTQICNIKNVAYCGLSVSGRGYWCLIPIAYPDKHEQHFKTLQWAFKLFGIKIDESCKDVSRLRGYSYDTDGYFNHNPELLYNFMEPETPIQSVKRKFNKSCYSGDKISVAVKMINDAPDGEKHNILLKAARLMGGYIAAGEVEEVSAIGALESAIQSRYIDSIEDARKTISDGIAYGKNEPISSDNSSFHSLEHPNPSQQELQHESIIFYSQVETFIRCPWDYEIKELEQFFNTTVLPDHSIALGPGVRIGDVSKFVVAELTMVTANNGKRFALPALERLQKLRTMLLSL